VGTAVEDEDGWSARLDLVEAVRERPAPHALGRRRKADRVRRALASGEALRAVLERSEEELWQRAGKADKADPRLAWLAENAPRWRDGGQKTLVFVAHRESLEWVRDELSRRAQVATGVFHEELSSARRDIEVARFRLADGPSVLVSTECGGEGRNFEFCHRLVLLDLPWNPLVVEQRIGRLDRIGRRWPVEVVYFPAPEGVGRDTARLFEELGLFREPLAGLEPELARVEAALEMAALSASGTLPAQRADTIVTGARAAQTRIREAAWREMHREPYVQAMAEAILERVPPDLEPLTEEVITAACERLFLHVEPHSGHVFSIELGNQALVDSLPGVPGGTSFLGTFDREEALADERMDFFAAGHPLVEGLLAHLEESPRGRVSVLRVALGPEKGLGLLALYKDGPAFETVALDAGGRPRPDWAEALSRRPLRTRRVPAGLVNAPGWEPAIRRMAAGLDPARRPVALAAAIVGP
jgi:ATP-dependent helicase HepA